MKGRHLLTRRNLVKGTICGLGAGALAWGLHGLGLFSGSNSARTELPAPVTLNIHPRTGVAVSALGYGCMRFPMQPNATSPRGSEIDEKEAFRLVDHALAHGLNYFDSAYFYHKGESEAVLGRALARHPRDSFLVATKMPGRIIESLQQAKDI